MQPIIETSEAANEGGLRIDTRCLLLDNEISNWNLNISQMDEIDVGKESSTAWRDCLSEALKEQVTWLRRLCFATSQFLSITSETDKVVPGSESSTPTHPERDRFDYTPLERPTSTGTKYIAGNHNLFQMFNAISWNLDYIDSCDSAAWQLLAELHFEIVKQAPRGWSVTAGEQPPSVANMDMPKPLPVDCDKCRVHPTRLIESGTSNSYDVQNPHHCVMLTRELAIHCLCEAVKAFLHVIRLADDQSSLIVFSNILRVLNLWFEAWQYGPLNDLVRDNVANISPTAWIRVLPQLWSRHSLDYEPLLPILQAIFREIVDAAPSELLFPLIVTCESTNENYRKPANDILRAFSSRYPVSQSTYSNICRLALL